MPSIDSDFDHFFRSAMKRRTKQKIKTAVKGLLMSKAAINVCQLETFRPSTSGLKTRKKIGKINM